MEISEILFLIGRVLFGGFFMMNRFNHFTKSDMITGFAQSRGMPLPKMMDMILFMRNIGLTGALLMFLELSRPWALSITEFF